MTNPAIFHHRVSIIDSAGQPHTLSLISHCVILMTHFAAADSQVFLISLCVTFMTHLPAADSEGDAAGRAGRAEDQEGHGQRWAAVQPLLLHLPLQAFPPDA